MIFDDRDSIAIITICCLDFHDDIQQEQPMNKLDLRHLHHPKVRDLAWALGTPSLVNHQKGLPMLSSEWWMQEFLNAQDWLLELDRDPSALLIYLDQMRKKNWSGF